MSDSRYQVDVSVTTRFLPEQSQPEQSRFAFSYSITIHNSGNLPAKLLSRHWLITNGDGQVQAGPGARGHPVLAMPNKCARSLKKMRTWAIGFLRTSSLFM